MDVAVIDYRAPSAFRPIDTFSCRRLSGGVSLRPVLDCLDGLDRADTGHRHLCTLDDLSQCCYTSGHAGCDERIAIGPDGTDFDDPESVRRFEARRLAHVAARLQDPALRVAWDDVCETLAAGAGDVAALVAMNRDPAHAGASWLPLFRHGCVLAGAGA